jgi:hypothetical protein
VQMTNGCQAAKPIGHGHTPLLFSSTGLDIASAPGEHDLRVMKRVHPHSLIRSPQEAPCSSL